MVIILFVMTCGIGIANADTNSSAVNNKDADIMSDYPDSNFGAYEDMSAGDSNLVHIVINFTLPSHSGTISKIELCLWRNLVSNSGYASNLSVHELSTDFIESEVTWNNRTSGTAWSSAGGDYSATEVARVNMSTTGTGERWVNWTVRGTGAINSMNSLTWGDTVDFIIIQSLSDYRRDYVVTKENGTAAVRPLMVVTYSSAAAGTPDPTNLQNTKGSTWVNHTWDAGAGANETDSYNVSINTTWHNTTNEYYNNTGLSAGSWSNITVWAWNSTNSELSTGSVSEDVQTQAAPAISSYAPLGTIWPEIQDSQLFNVTADQSTQCRWYINGSLAQTNATPSLTHAYTNTSLNGGGCNVTAVVNNTNGTDSQTWLFEVGADSITYIVLKDQPTNQTLIAEWNVTRIGGNVTDWGIWQNHTYNGWDYVFRFTNGTKIMNLTASSDNDTLWFNHTSLLPIGVYFINVTNSSAPAITDLTSTPGIYECTINWTVTPGSLAQNRAYYGTNEADINAWVNGTWSSWKNNTKSRQEYYAIIDITGLAASTKYYWKPESRLDDGPANTSVAAANFTTAESTGIETFVNPSLVSAGAAAILFVAAAGRFAISAWRNRRRKRRN